MEIHYFVSNNISCKRCPMIHLPLHGNMMDDTDWTFHDFQAQKRTEIHENSWNLERLNNAMLHCTDETSAGSLVSVQNSFTAK